MSARYFINGGLTLSVRPFFSITFVNPIRYSVINGVEHTRVRYSSNMTAPLGEHFVIDIVLVNINQSVSRGRPPEQRYAIAIRNSRVRST